jgi:hypothetical protein
MWKNEKTLPSIICVVVVGNFFLKFYLTRLTYNQVVHGRTALLDVSDICVLYFVLKYLGRIQFSCNNIHCGGDAVIGGGGGGKK